MNRPINERLILSLYDFTEVWASPYIKAKYPVMLWDYKVEGDILDWSEKKVEKWICGYEQFVYGIIAAPPCDDFAVSGARWWQEKDKDKQRIETSCALVEIVKLFVDMCPNIKFWALENPVGRLETLCPQFKEFRKMSFNPCDYGDPYTKKTILWGDFNTNLEKNFVEPEFITYKKKDGTITRFAPQFAKTGGTSAKTKTIRSATPPGFAKAFFNANR